MLLHVVHETRYDYAPPVKTAQHMAHLKPAHNARQQLLQHEFVISPAAAQRSEAADVYGNTRAFFSLQSAHDVLKVVAQSLVATSAPLAPQSNMAWEDAREHLRYHRGAAYDPAAEFAFASPHVPRHDNLERIHDDFVYEPEATDVSTPALEALDMRRGVCQDFAHVMLACLRSLGLPARYVSGYLLTEPPPGRKRLVGRDASHAWVSIYLPDGQGPGAWTDLDPTNRRAPGEDYVVLATGRDYSDVSPIRGVIHGGARHELHVAVTVTPVDAAAAAAATAPAEPGR